MGYLGLRWVIWREIIGVQAWGSGSSFSVSWISPSTLQAIAETCICCRACISGFERGALVGHASAS